MGLYMSSIVGLFMGFRVCKELEECLCDGWLGRMLGFVKKGKKTLLFHLSCWFQIVAFVHGVHGCQGVFLENTPWNP